MNKKAYLVSLLFIVVITISAQQKTVLWKQISDSDISLIKKKEVKSQPENYKLFELNLKSLKKKLALVKSRNLTTTSNVVILFPNAEGQLERFRVFGTETMHPELAIKFPNIKTFVAQGIDDLTATMHFTITRNGLHAMMLSGKRGDTFINVYTEKDNYYIVFLKSAVKNNLNFECLVDEVDLRKSSKAQIKNDTNDKKLRTYRLALSCTAEYGNVFATNTGTELEDIMAEMVIAINRVNGVYERDLGITLQFVANNDLIMFYGNINADPWNGTNYSGINQTELNNRIGNNNYDIGHNFNTGGGGSACVKCVCSANVKARAYTGIPNPVGDVFYIDYVAHEMGHQFGAYHTMNTCARSGAGQTQVEPASGSSILSYAGICPTNVQLNSDAHFNYVNIRDISGNIQEGTINCAEITNLVNEPPIANAGSNYTIPKSTAYVLEGTATDPDGLDSLTYSWSQNDTEESPGDGAPQSNYQIGPMYRVLLPTISPNRYMPKFNDVLSGNLTPTWEVTPSVGRNMEFAFLVRDNNVLGGQTSADLMTVTVDGGSGPFQVTSQSTIENWVVGTPKLISWDVASTNIAPVNATNVDILITDDGGVTFTTIVNNVPNSGSYTITVPNIITSTARIMVRGSNNIFYAINNSNIIIQTDFYMNFSNNSDSVCSPNDAVYNFTYDAFDSFSEIVTFSATGNPVGSTVNFNPPSTNTNGTSISMTISNITNAMEGSHTVNVQGTSASTSKNKDITLNIYSETIPVTTLVLPINNTINVPDRPITLTWSAEAAASYDIEIATDINFISIVESATVTTNSYLTGPLTFETTYYWRVRVNNSCGTGSYSSAFSFMTVDCLYCESTYSNTNLDWIDNVTLNNINNNSGQGGAESYEDFFEISTDLEIGLTYPISVSVNVDGNFIHYVKVFIDWNQDCDFNDANESINLGSHGGTFIFNGNITVPVGAVLRNTKMRVIEQRNVGPNACNTHPLIFGETEDYSVNILASIGTSDNLLINELLVFMPENELINIQMTNNLTIKNVKIYDILGKLLENVSTNNSTIQLPVTINKGTILFVNVILENGQRLVKKMIVNK